jgi:tetratricopeptide (TPR) repeat protein
MSRPLSVATVLVVLAGCAHQPSFDSVAALREVYASQVGAAGAASVEVPFELDADIVQTLATIVPPEGTVQRRVNRLIDFVFAGLELRYALAPTRNAVQTYRAREGNCLSFVNLFVGMARQQRLPAFYVEVTDLQRWSYRNGMVISQGHIVGGLYVNGLLQTFDFLPYRPKSYRDFAPIDDRTAAAHYFNNLGAEALLQGDLDTAYRHLQTATGVVPDFVKAINNLAVTLARRSEPEAAIALCRKGLELEPDNVALLSNLARFHQERGELAESAAILTRIEEVNTANPYFYIFRGETALASGDHQAALAYMTEALRRDSELPAVHIGLAKVYLALGDLDKARRQVERALRLDATDAEARRLAALLASP